MCPLACPPRAAHPRRAPYPHRTRSSKLLVTGDQAVAQLPLRGPRERLQRLEHASASLRYPRPDGVQLRGPGGVLAFELAGGLEAARTVMGSARLITPAVSLGAVDTLIEHPAGLTHRLVDAQARAAAGITDGLLRLSVGLEDVDDLWQDLDDALARIRLGAV